MIQELGPDPVRGEAPTMEVKRQQFFIDNLHTELHCQYATAFAIISPINLTSFSPTTLHRFVVGEEKWEAWQSFQCFLWLCREAGDIKSK